MKSLHQSIKNVLKEGKPPALERRAILEAEDVDINALAGEAPVPEAPAAPAPEVAPEASAAPEAPEAPEAEEPKKKGGKEEKPKYAAHISKEGQDLVVLLTKDDLEELIHEHGAKSIIKLYELGKEAKVPKVKVEV